MSVAALVLGLASGAVLAASAHEIDRDADMALANLYESTPVANQLAEKAKGILIFHSIIKAGLMIGGRYGDGVLRQQGKSTGYYNSSAVSYGLQADAQSFGYVMFFMTDKSLDYLKSSDGWEVGIGPTVVGNGVGVNLQNRADDKRPGRSR